MNAGVTLAEVARGAGVSTATASYVLGGSRSSSETIRVSEATRERVRSAAAHLNYVPSSAGRGLALGSTGRIAIVVPNLYQPYFAQMVEALTLELEERDLTPTVRLARDGRAECDAVLGATTADVEGVLICPHHLTAELLGDRSPSRPSVQVGGGATGLLDCMVMDEFTGSLAVARHLVRTGRRRIAFITDSPRSPEHSLRFRSYAQALEESGIEVRPEMRIAGSDWDRRESGIEATLALLRSGTSFDAIMCVNDAVAIGALRTLRRSGVRVPADVAVTGFDNTAEGGFTAPTLTTVDPDIGGMARGAVQMLAERLSGMTAEPRAQSVPSRLVVRRSTGSAEGESAEG